MSDCADNAPYEARLNEQEFRALAEAVPQIVWATQPDGRNIYFNQRWVDYTGLTMEESYGHGWNTPFHPDDKQRAWLAWQRATQLNECYSLECRLRRADGVYRWWLIRGEPMRGAQGEILKWFGTCTDIEELKRTETLLHEANALLDQRIAERTAALRESEALYRAIGESIDYGVWICAPDGRNTYASESFLNLVGITQEQCSNFGWGDVLHPDDAERTIASWQECVRTGGKWDIVHRFRGVDNQWHHVLARGIPIKNEQGDITCWAGINLDITDLKRTEEELRESQKQQSLLADILKNSSQPFGLGYPDGHIGLVNDAFAQLTGYTIDELLSIDWSKAITPPQWQEIEHEKLAQLHQTGQPVRYEKEYLRKDGSSVPVELLVHLSTDTDGNPEYYYSFVTDISERKVAELALKILNKELEKKNIELTNQNKLFIGRELRMVELKDKITELENKIIELSRTSY